MKLFTSIYEYFKVNIPARVIALLWLVMFSSVVPLLFSSDAMNTHQVDVFILITKYRYPENIAYDLSEWFNITTLFYCIYLLLPNKKYQNYAKPFLIISLLGLPAYFLFYSQYVTLITTPLILIWYVWKITEQNAKEGDNARSGDSDNTNS